MSKHKKQWKKSALLLSWLLLALLPTALAQRPFQYKYTLDDGLPYPEVTNVNFTKNGELWASYSNGESLSRFDGLNWTHYPLSDMKLPLRFVFWSEDGNGVWFIDQSERHLNFVCFTKTGEWKTYRFEGKNAPWPDMISGSARFMDEQFFAHHFDPELDTFIKSDKPYFSPEEQPTGKVRGIRSTFDGTILLRIQTAEKPDLTDYFGGNFEHSIDLPHPSFQPFFVSEIDLRGTFVEAGKLYWYAQRQSRPLNIVLPSGRTGDFVDRVYLNYWGSKTGNNLILGVVAKDPQNGTLYLYRLDSLGQPHLLLGHLHDDYYGAFSQDEQGHWWYGTATGLVRTNQLFLTFDESNPAMVNGLHAIGEDPEGNIWLGGYNGTGGFSVWDGEELQRRTFSKDAMPILPGALRSRSGSLYFFHQKSQGLAAIKNGRFHHIYIPGHEYLHGYFFLPLSDGKIGLGLQTKGLGIAEETNGLISSIRTISKEKGLLLDNVLTVAEDQAGRLWAGHHSQGIAIYDPQRDTAVTWLRSPELPGSIGAMSSCVDENGTLWLGAHNGLYRLERPHEFDYLNSNPTDFFLKIELPGRDTSMVTFLQNTVDYLVAGTYQGVYFLDKNYHGEHPRIFSLKYGSDIDGSGSEQNAVLLDSKGQLWIGTQTGATLIDLDSLRFDTSATSLALTSFRAGDTQIPINGRDLGQLPSSKRNLQFSFAPSGNRHLRDNLYYDVMVIREDGDTLFQRISTRQKDGLQIDHLPHGDYTLHLMAYKHNVLSGHAEYHFTVPRLLGESPWFWVIATSFFMGALLTFIYIRKRHQLALEKSKRERDGLKIQALSNFFNPHFINNALHWVQGKYRKDPDTATMIGRLADSVDLLFKNTQSGQACHSLELELQIVKNYLQIQQVRFGMGLSAHFDLPEPSRYADVSVPAMLIQIHSENAVEQGIRNRKGAGKFSLSVQPEPKGCRIVIEDDGRGRPPKPAERIVARKGSTQVMSDLVRLFNQYNPVPLTVSYEDRIFNNETEGGYGTRVIIYVPKNYNYELSKTKGLGR